MKAIRNDRAPAGSPVAEISSGNLTIIPVTGLESLKAHFEAWNKLLLELPLPMPMWSYIWVVTALQHFLLPDEDWVCLMAYENLAMVGILPLIISRPKFGLRSKPIFRTIFNWHTLSVGCMTRPGYEKTVVTGILDSLAAVHPNWNGVEVTRVQDMSPLVLAVNDSPKGFRSIRRLNGYGSYIKVSGSYDDYLAGLDGKFVRNLRRLERKMENLPELELSIITDGAEKEEHFERFLDVEKRSWKGKKGSAIAQTPALAKFYRDLSRGLGEQGWLEWYFLSTMGKTIAAMMTIRIGGRLVIHKIGYDEKYSSYSPGNKLFEKMIQRAFADGAITEIDCLTAYPWNENWNMATREFYDLEIFPNRPRAFLTGYLPAKMLNYIGHGSYVRKKGRILYDIAGQILGGRKKKPQNGTNGMSR
ncbi:hypothetical protein TRIP_C10056 [Candidatus Zixiibacteriota bacterium]|nr:hypothetical protein TRIP_C10056 [candidate division Zixibacteria bacterium]